MHLLLSALVALTACFHAEAAHEPEFQNAAVVLDAPGKKRASRDNDELMPSSPLTSSLSLRQDEIHTSSLRRSLRKQIGDCKGSKFQINIHFDSHPEDFSMKLINDDKNKTVWALDDPNHTYADPKFQHATVGVGVCLPREWCWVLTVYDKSGDGYVRLRCV
jgi:hypothetical protein